MSRGVLLPSANCLVYANGAMYASIKGFHWSNPTPRKKIRGLDDPSVIELATTTNDTSFSMDVYREKNSGGPRGKGLKAVYHQLPQERYFSIMVIDRETGGVFFRADFCSVESESWNVVTKSLVEGTLQCSCLDDSDEANQTVE